MNFNEELHDKKILIVEDDSISMKIMKTILEHNGFYNIFTSVNANDAIEMIETENISIVLMNYKMPGMDGIEATNYITNNLNVPESSIMIVTSKNNDYIARSSFDSGAIDFISKPINPLEFISRIENVLKMKIKMENANKKSNKLEKMNESLKEVMFSKNKKQN